MSIQDLKIKVWKNPIVNEADRPNRSASDMKAVFDSNTNELKDAHNSLVDAVELAAETVRNDLGDKQYLRGDGTYGVPEVGQAANGMPPLGRIGQILSKASNADFDAKWVDQEAIFTATLLADGWSDRTYTVENEMIAENSVVELLPPISAEMTDKQLEVLQAANLQDGGQTEGSVVLVARGDMPEIDLTIRVLVRRPR